MNYADMHVNYTSQKYKERANGTGGKEPDRSSGVYIGKEHRCVRFDAVFVIFFHQFRLYPPIKDGKNFPRVGRVLQE